MPTAILVGTGIGARRGILIKDPAALERSHGLTHIILDKTGTLTTGKPAVTSLYCVDQSLDDDAMLRLAAAAEQDSEHPLGKAIVAYARQRGVEVPPANRFESATAAGVTALGLGHCAPATATAPAQKCGDCFLTFRQRQHAHGNRRQDRGDVGGDGFCVVDRRGVVRVRSIPRGSFVPFGRRREIAAFVDIDGRLAGPGLGRIEIEGLATGGRRDVGVPNLDEDRLGSLTVGEPSGIGNPDDTAGTDLDPVAHRPGPVFGALRPVVHLDREHAVWCPLDPGDVLHTALPRAACPIRVDVERAALTALWVPVVDDGTPRLGRVEIEIGRAVPDQCDLELRR